MDCSESTQSLALMLSILYTFVFTGLALVWIYLSTSHGHRLRSKVTEYIRAKSYSDSIRLRKTAIMPGVAVQKLAPIFSQKIEYASDESAGEECEDP